MNNQIFGGVYYAISRTLDVERRKDLSAALDANGGTPVALEDSRLTHFITNTLPLTDPLESLPPDSPANLVTPLWVDRSLVFSRPQGPLFYSPDPAMIFSGVIATATDLSSSDLEVLSAGISALGGQWRTSLTKEVTHLFALATGSVKYETAMHFKSTISVKVLVPHWFDDSVRLGMRGLPTEEYEWPEPKVFKAAWQNMANGDDSKDVKKPRKLSTEKRVLYDTVLASGTDLPPSPAAPQPRNIWNGLSILLSSSLELTASQRTAHEADIRREGGVVVESGSPAEEATQVETADVFVTRYRAGPAYVKAYKLDKTIGSLPWLWYVRSTGTLSRPTDQLLHYPIPRTPIGGFQSHVITVTNYTGKDREYLKKLIAAMGAQFTPSMSGKNTVVIAAYIQGTKTTKAQSWSIPVVNHTWLEDCFVQWRTLSLANEKYMLFPPGVDFGTLLADRALGRIGWDPAELDALEQELDVEAEAEVDSQEQGSNSKTTQPQPPSGTGASAKEVEDVIAVRDDDGDVVMTGDVSVGGYIDLEIPLLDGKPKSRAEQEDMEVNHGQGEGGSRLSRMKPRSKSQVQKKPESRSTAKPVSKSPAKPASKAKEVIPLEIEDDEEVMLISPPKPPRTKLVRRLNRKSGEQSMSVVEDEAPDVLQEPPAPESPSKGKRGRPSQREIEEREINGGPHPSVKAPSKGRDGPADVDEDTDMEDEESSERQKPKPKAQKTASTSRRKAAAISDTDEDEQPPERVRSLRRKSSQVTISEPVSSAKASGQQGSTRSSESKRSPDKASTSKQPSPKKSLGRSGSFYIQANDSIAQSSPTRGRLIVGSGKKADAPSASRERSPPPPPAPRKSRGGRAQATPEAGPSTPSATPTTLTRTPSKRSAATKATQKLREEVMPDVMNFQKEMKRGAVRSAWDHEQASAKVKEKETEKSDEHVTSKGKKRVSVGDGEEVNDDGEEPQKKKRRTSTAGTAGNKAKGKAPESVSDDDEEPEPAPKESKSRRKPESTVSAKSGADKSSLKNIRIMTTQVNLSDDVIKSVTKMGAKFTTKPSECTHLVTRNLVRTEKFLCAMSVAPFVVTDRWVQTCVNTKRFLPEEQFILKDPENEKKFGFKLTDALQRAKANGGKLFAGKTFYVTPKLPVDTKLLKAVVTTGGGQLSTQTPTVRMLNNHDDRFVISCPADASIWRPLAEKGYPIYSQELILTGTLKQEVDWENPAYIVSGSS